MASRVALLVLVAIVCIGFAAGEVPADCCLTVTDKPFPRRWVASYAIQDVGQGCAISATVLVTKAARKLCVPHPRDSEWVARLLHRLQEAKEAHK